MAILVAIAVNEDGYREVLGAAEGMKKDKVSWVSFFQWLRGRGLDGVKLVVGDKCLGMLETVGEVFPEAKYQRCTVHFYRKALGLHVIVSGNANAKESILHAGADQYLDYRKENYWEKLSGVDYVIDTLGAGEFEHELSVLKKSGRLLSLRTGPNREFAVRNNFSRFKKMLFTLAGAKNDKAAQKQGKEYRFMFVRSDGKQLRKITKIVEQNHISPKTDPCVFSLEKAQEALQLVAHRHTEGKVILQL